jgi:isopentenyl-diphosphate delta-isomerase
MSDIILVDPNDVEIGHGSKLDVHRSGQLHRAFSVFVFDDDGRLLLQRRAAVKYHSPGLWSNTCCGHPRAGERTIESARRRLREEMGIDCPLTPAFAFTYRAELDRDLIEHEIDHVFVGRRSGDPEPDPSEVGEWKWVEPDDLAEGFRRNPERYTAWLGLALQGLEENGWFGDVRGGGRSDHV